ncbi:MAG: class I SAM-dependent methyltransferase [Burkholderiales bacterium]|nr:MAG: class I SAM-dependent methyltransferase [Burkholderiales bacterium]
MIRWSEEGIEHSARWRSERGAPPPRSVVVADDTMSADEAYGLACQGVALLWRGDFQNARQMLTALANRTDRKPRLAAKGGKGAKGGKDGKGGRGAQVADAAAAAPAKSPVEVFNLQRQARSQRARTLGMLLIPLEDGHVIPLRRAPDLKAACTEAWGAADGSAVVAMRELLGVNGAHEWRSNGIEVPAIGGRIHPHYGVFAPTRAEYVELVARAPLPKAAAALGTAFDVGTGTGVLAAVLARRGLARVVATDMDPRALACARDNVARLGLAERVEVVQADLFPEGRAELVVCNPPWVPARPSSPLEHGVYDADGRMLGGFLSGLAAHLAPGGEGWLILSDLAEHLGLRTRDALLAAIAAGGLVVVDRIDVKPAHKRAFDATDPLHAARSREKTSLWRLAAAG